MAMALVAAAESWVVLETVKRSVARALLMAGPLAGCTCQVFAMNSTMTSPLTKVSETSMFAFGVNP